MVGVHGDKFNFMHGNTHSDTLARAANAPSKNVSDWGPEQNFRRYPPLVNIAFFRVSPHHHTLHLVPPLPNTITLHHYVRRHGIMITSKIIGGFVPCKSHRHVEFLLHRRVKEMVQFRGFCVYDIALPGHRV